MKHDSEFYAGYLPMPEGIRQFIGRLLPALGIGVALVAAALVAGQNPFAGSTFEFQQFHDFQGTLIADPYPALLTPDKGPPWLLVGPGKHGAGPLGTGQARLTGD